MSWAKSLRSSRKGRAAFVCIGLLLGLLYVSGFVLLYFGLCWLTWRAGWHSSKVSSYASCSLSFFAALGIYAATPMAWRWIRDGD